MQTPLTPRSQRITRHAGDRVGRGRARYRGVSFGETAFRRVARSAYGQASKNVNDGTKLQRIREILDRAAAELEQLEKSG